MALTDSNRHRPARGNRRRRGGEAVAARGFVIGGGYGKLKSSSIRIGHMGDHSVAGLGRCLAAVSDALRALRSAPTFQA